jgi:hypothetical protein
MRDAMNHQLLLALFLGGFTVLVLYYDRKRDLLRDLTEIKPKPYSFARVQMAWWSVIILSAFAAVVFSTLAIPKLDDTILILMGIGIGTTGIARTVDVSDIMHNRRRTQDDGTDGFLLDLLSDNNGASISRFQAIAFNVIFGVWFVVVVWHNLGQVPLPEQIIPKIDATNLVLLGIGSGGYLALKTMENKSMEAMGNKNKKPK